MSVLFNNVKLSGRTSFAVLTTAPVPEPSVSYENYITALFKTTSVNGANNNTFIDSSSNALTITRNGNVTQGSVSPYGNTWSVDFDGTSDYITNGSATSAVAYGTDDFTWECWVYLTETLSNSYIIDHGVNGGLLAIQSGYVTFYDQTILLQPHPQVPLNTWQHIAAVRHSGTVNLYLNGVQLDTGSPTSNHSFGSQQIYIGRHGGNGLFFKGKISNLRLVNGVAVYTSAFVPSTAPLTAIPGTALLMCQNNRLKDNSVNNFALTVDGTPKITKFSPFASIAYSPAVHGGSIYFDGTDDYLTTPYNEVLHRWDDSDFTIESWVYAKDLSTFQYMEAGSTHPALVGRRTATNVYDTWSFGPLADGTVSFHYYVPAGYLQINVNSTLKITANAWHHIAMTKTNGGITIFVNGISQGITTITGTPLYIDPTTPNITIGQGYNRGIQGYISDLRITKSSVYSSNFTVPTTPLTAVANTQLLLSGTNAAIYDATQNSIIEVNGVVDASTTIAKYGTSMKFDITSSTSDYLVINPVSPTLYQLGSKDFTIECWVRFNSTSGFNTIIGNWQDASVGLFIAGYQGRISVWLTGNGADIEGPFYSVDQWYHVAVVQNATVTTLYVDGVAAGTAPYMQTASTQSTYIGGWIYNGSLTDRLDGYLEDFRITYGVARYTENFTPPTTAF